MELMFAEWEDGERFSFEDSDRFEEDSLCSFISEAESLCQNWRGWRKQSAGPNSPTVKIKDGQVIPLVELSAKQVAFHIPFEVVEKVYPPVPEQLQLRIAYWSFPENEEDIRLYSCLANGSPDEFQRGEQLYRMRAVKDPLQIGFHLSATVVSPQAGQSKGAYNVAVMFDRCRITSCSCTCGAGAKWCAHVVALCLFRIHNASAVCLRAPVSESLSRLQRDQLQKFAQYLISELPQQILPTAQRLLDELLSSQSTAINTVCGAPDPTAGPSASDQSTWYLDESTLSDNIKKTLHKFCGPSPVVFSDVNSMYLSSTEPPAAAEWACLLRPLRGREPEGIWNLLSIVREMFKRRDSNAAPLLEILTEQCLTYEQIIGWWYSVRTSASHSSASGHTGRSNGQSEVAAHACASMCDEMVVLWRLAVLDPTMSPQRRWELSAQLKQWHLKVIEIVKRGQHRKSLDKLFQGFKPAVESCYFNWELAYPLPGITYCSADKKSASFCWARAQEVAVRPKETLVSKRKGLAAGAAACWCAWEGVSLALDDGEGDVQGRGGAGAAAAPPPRRAGRPSCRRAGRRAEGRRARAGSTAAAAARRQQAQGEQRGQLAGARPGRAQPGRRLQPGARAEASNTFDFLPPPPEMLPAPGRCCASRASTPRAVAKETAAFDGKRADHAPLTPEAAAACFPKENAVVVGAGPGRGLGRRWRWTLRPRRIRSRPTEPREGGGATAAPAPQAAEAPPDPAGEDDYQAYYLSAASEEGVERGVPDGNHEEEPDIFAGIKPLEQEGRMEVLFACAEALHAHGYSNEACRLAVELAGDLLSNPRPEGGAAADQGTIRLSVRPSRGKKSKVSTSRQTQVATNTLSKAAFLLTVLSERLEYHTLAFSTGMFSLELQRPPASTKALEVKLAYQESEVVALLKKIPLGVVEMGSIRDRAEQLRDGNFCDYRPVLPLMLASFIFDVLCTPVVSPTGSRPQP
ncbi:hypothetical protein ANANG_G00305020 [Anguilla anguilla]|uniref:SWIM-type domain-containing protein n=1 Tax=Anguilla anguilla TaxID=7936 RepID=A0A9D3LRV4_ANGAN|nr:hypothetical protein ANANG_G00305020 [Anguilla anguilla]